MPWINSEVENVIREKVNDMKLSQGNEGVRYKPQRVPKNNEGVLVLGLGGTGTKIVRRTREMFLERFQRTAGQDLPPFSKFLAIDTDHAELEGSDLLPDETLMIGDFKIPSILQPANRDSLPDSVKSWLNPSLVSRSPTGIDGAEGVRQIGRFTLFNKAQTVYNSLRNALTQISTCNGSIYVALCAGLAGGTGAGTFLDVAYLLRAAADSLHLSTRLKLMGFLALPDAFSSLPQADVHATAMRQSNGYACLRELDYWMKVEDRHDDYQQNYFPGLTVAWDHAPFNDCYLLSGQNVAGGVPARALNHLHGVVSEFLVSMFAGEENSDGSGEFTYQMWRTNAGNIRNNAAGMLQYPVGISYSAIGAANGQLPMQELVQREFVELMAELNGTAEGAVFIDSEAVFHHAPNNADETEYKAIITDALGERVNTPFQAIRKKAAKDIADVNALRHDHRIIPHDISQDDHNALYLYDVQLLAAQRELLSQNGEANKAVDALNDALLDIFSDPKKGPVYLSRMLDDKPGMYSVDRDEFDDTMQPGLLTLLSRLDALATKATSNAKQADANYRRSLGTAGNEYRTIINATIVLPNGPTATRYYDACDYMDKMLKEKYKQEALAEMYTRMHDRVEYLNNQIIKPYLAILCHLIRLSKDDKVYMGLPAYKQNRPNYYTDIMDAASMMEYQRNTLMTQAMREKLLITLFEDMAKPFRSGMHVAADQMWLNHDINSKALVGVQVRQGLSRVVNEAFKRFNTLSLEEFWRSQYPNHINQDGTLNMTAVAAQLNSNLAQKANPMFVMSSNNIVVAPQSNRFLTVPRTNPALCNAMQQANGVVKRSDIDDRLFLVCSLEGLCLMNYGTLGACEEAYTNHLNQDDGASAGVHLCESKSRDWRILPNPVPRKARPKNYQIDRQINSDARNIRIIDEAIGRGDIVISADQMLDWNATAYLLTDDMVKWLSNDANKKTLYNDDALIRFLGQREKVKYSFNRFLLAAYNDDESISQENIYKEMTHDLILRTPAVIKKLERDELLLRELTQATLNVKKIKEYAKRIIMLRVFHKLEFRPGNLVVFEYGDQTARFFGGDTSSVDLMKKYAFDLDSAISERLYAISQPNSEMAGVYEQIKRIEEGIKNAIRNIGNMEDQGAAFIATFGADAKALYTEIREKHNKLQVKVLDPDEPMTEEIRPQVLGIYDTMCSHLKEQALQLGVMF